MALHFYINNNNNNNRESILWKTETQRIVMAWS